MTKLDLLAVEKLQPLGTSLSLAAVGEATQIGEPTFLGDLRLGAWQVQVLSYLGQGQRRADLVARKMMLNLMAMAGPQ